MPADSTVASPGPRRARVWWTALATGSAILAAIGILALCGVFAFEVRIPEARIQSIVDGRLPVERRSGPLDWRAETARVSVLPAGRIGIDARLHAEAAGRSGVVLVAGSAGLVYRDEAFWLNALDVSSLRIARDGVAPEASENLADRAGEAGEDRRRLRDRMRDAASAGMDRVRGSAAAGRLGDTVERMADAAENVVRSNAVPVLGSILAVVPVYRMDRSPDWRVRLGTLALEGVTTDGTDIVATLDPAGGVARIVLIGLVSVFVGAAFLAALVRVGPTGTGILSAFGP